MELLMLPETGIRSSSCLDADGLFTKRQMALIRDAGFGLAELNLNHPWTGLDYKDQGVILELSREAAKNSIRLSAHAPTELQLTEFDKSADEIIVSVYRDIVNRVSGCGIKSIVIHPCTGNASVSGRNNGIRIRNLISRLEKILPACESSETTLLMETMTPGRISSGMDTLIRAADAVDSPFLKICLDTNHLNLSEDICTAAERAGKRVGEIHLNDNHGLMEEHLLPYSGTIDWENFFKSLSVISYEKDMILEPSRLADGTPYGPGHTALMLRQAKEAADKITAFLMENLYRRRKEDEKIRTKRKDSFENCRMER